MSIWKLKAVVQKGISYLPYSHNINYLFQKYITKGLNLTDELFEDKLEHLHRHISFYRKYSCQADNFKVLELGTGWFPVVPVGMYLFGASGVITVDRANLLKSENICATLQKFMDYFAAGKLEIGMEKLQVLKYCLESCHLNQPVDILSIMNIKTIIGDAANLPQVKDDSLDLIISNNTFEHIPADELAAILKEFKRISAPGCIMSHFIDMSDHFAHMDPSISIYNFLKYSDEEWKWINNNVQPQNRLRINNYRELYRQLHINIDEELNEKGDLAEIARTPIDKRFSDTPLADLAVSHSYMVSKIEK